MMNEMRYAMSDEPNHASYPGLPSGRMSDDEMRRTRERRAKQPSFDRKCVFLKNQSLHRHDFWFGPITSFQKEEFQPFYSYSRLASVPAVIIFVSR